MVELDQAVLQPADPAPQCGHRHPAPVTDLAHFVHSLRLHSLAKLEDKFTARVATELDKTMQLYYNSERLRGRGTRDTETNEILLKEVNH